MEACSAKQSRHESPTWMGMAHEPEEGGLQSSIQPNIYRMFGRFDHALRYVDDSPVLDFFEIKCNRKLDES